MQQQQENAAEQQDAATDDATAAAAAAGEAEPAADAEAEAGPELTAEERLALKLQADDSLTELDFSSQGLTMAPSSLFTKSHITILNLSSNNIRGLPAEISQLVNLRRLDLSRNGLRCAHPRDFTSLPRELESIRTLTELSISECSLMHVPPAVWSVASLRRLDISRNKVNVIPDDIMRLEQLEYLNATQTGLKTLPDEIVCCDRLQCVMLFGNPLTALPDTLRDLTQLHTLHVNHRVFAATVDTETEGMLQRQQLQSEHIPSVVFHIQKLKELDLESCKLNQLPKSLTRSLLELNIAENFFPNFPEVVCSLRHLTQLNLSRNGFQKLPEAVRNLKSLRQLLAADNRFTQVDLIGELLQLESLDLSGNCIQRLPDSFSKLQQLRVLLLPGNRIDKIPHSLCCLHQLHTLDLTGNCIRSIPQEMQQMTELTSAHQFNGLFKRGLWLHKNPIEDPPAKIWNTADPSYIWGYMQKMQIQNVPKQRPCKLVLVGDHQSGKTSLLNALQLGRQKLTKPVSDFTRGYSIGRWKSENKCKFVLVEASGHRQYEPLVPKLLDDRAVTCVVFDLSEYRRVGFEVVSRWLKLLQLRLPAAVVLLIGTKLDLCVSDNNTFNEDDSVVEGSDSPVVCNADELEDSLREDLEKFLSSWESDCERHFSEDAPARQKLRILPQLLLVSSCEPLQGIQQLRDCLERVTVDLQLLPHLQKYVPSNWKAFMEAVKRLPGLYLHWEQLEEFAETKNIRGQQLCDCIEYFFNCGQILWQKQHPRLQHILFHRPQLLQRFLSRLLPTQLEDFLDYDANALFRSCGKLSSEQFAEAKEVALRNGQLSWPLVRCLVFGFGGDRQLLAEALHCLEFLEVACCTMPPSVPVSGLHSRPVLTLPHLVAESSDAGAEFEEAQATWQQLSVGCLHESALRMRFPLHRPPAIFTSISVCLHSLCQSRIDWPACIYCEINHCHLLLTEAELDDQLVYSLRADVRSASEVKVQQLLQWLRQFVSQEQQFAPGICCQFSDC